MLQGPPGAAYREQQEAARAFGLVLPDPAPEPEVEVWAEHWPAVRLFCAMRTQLRFSFAGVEGFDYAALPVCEQRLGVTPQEAAEAFAALRVMEIEMLAWEQRRSS